MASPKLGYLFRSARGWFRSQRWTCPNCGSAEWKIVSSKYLVTSLVRCQSCQILYRAPTDQPGFGNDFYQEDYQSGLTTRCPSPSELAALKAARFRGTEKDFSERLALLDALGVKPPARLLDYGASWGYGTWQLEQAGYEVVGYDVSRARAKYAREQLNVNVVDELKSVPTDFAVFFSCHVLEHLPNLSEVLQFARQRVHSGGLFIALTPNGSSKRLQRAPGRYHRAWGAVHPLLLDEQFYRKCFAGLPKLLATSPYDLERIRQWDLNSDCTLDLSGDELFVVTVLQ